MNNWEGKSVQWYWYSSDVKLTMEKQMMFQLLPVLFSDGNVSLSGAPIFLKEMERKSEY